MVPLSVIGVAVASTASHHLIVGTLVAHGWSTSEAFITSTGIVVLFYVSSSAVGYIQAQIHQEAKMNR